MIRFWRCTFLLEAVLVFPWEVEFLIPVNLSHGSSGMVQPCPGACPHLPRAAQTWGSKAPVTSVQGQSDSHKHKPNNFGGSSQNDALKIHEHRWL